MSHIFISYSRKDQSYARKLAENLRQRGFNIWIDDRIDYGERWLLTIVKAIENCAAFVVIMSPDSENSEWVEREILLAQREKKPIFPVLLAGREFALLITIQFADVRDNSFPKDDFYEHLRHVLHPQAKSGVFVAPMDNTLPLKPKEAQFERRKIYLIVFVTIIAFVITLIYTSYNGKGKNIDATEENLFATPLPGAIRTDGKGVSQAYVPSGCYVMGSDPTLDPHAEADEQPQHEVCLDNFLIDQYEVTNAAYQVFIGDSGYEKREYWSDEGWTWKEQNQINSPACLEDKNFSLPQQPVVCVSWYEAEAYANWRGGRLPTEAEWEYAARSSESWIYPYGNQFISENSNFCDWNCEESLREVGLSDGFRHPAPIGSYIWGKSWINTYEMVGNVWEWTHDWYEASYYESSPRDNPQGPESGKIVTVRGGSWNLPSYEARSANRYYNFPFGADRYIGFRVVTDIE